MKRMMILAAAAVGILAFAEMAQAAGGGPRATASSGCGAAGCHGPRSDGGGKYGLHPLFSRGGWGKKSGGCDTCGSGGKGCGKAGCGKAGCGSAGCAPTGPSGYGPDGSWGPQNGYTGQMPGTLVFPNHPYTRSPRDFFMVQPR